MYPPFADESDYLAAFGSVPDSASLALAAASAAVRGYCRWHIYPEVTETLVLDGMGGGVLLLPTLRLSAITALSETQRGQDQTPVSLTPASDLEWSAAGMVWRHDGRCWTRRARGISITITHGYDEIPAEITSIVLDVAKRGLSNPNRLSAITVGSRSEQYAGSNSSRGPGGLFLDEMSKLDPYRRML